MKLCCAIAALLLLALPLGLDAQTRDCHIPFAFVAFDSDFGSGDYSLTLLANHVKLTPTDAVDGTARLLVARRVRQVKPDGEALLLFEKIGQNYVLREFRTGDSETSMSFPLSAQRKVWEKRLIAQGHPSEFVLIAVNR